MKKGKCLECGRPVTRPGTRCHRCQGKINYQKYLKPAPLKIDWPTLEQLEERIAVTGLSETSRYLGVSRQAVAKRFRLLKAEQLERFLEEKK